MSTCYWFLFYINITQQHFLKTLKTYAIQSSDTIIQVHILYISKSPPYINITTSYDLCNICICSTTKCQINTPFVHLGIIVHV